jgi:hypothetical protein
MTSLSVPGSATFAEIDASADAMASILASVTDAVLIKQNVKYKVVYIPQPEPAGSTPIVRSGAFIFFTDIDTPDGIVTIPAIKDSVISDAEPFAGVAIDRDNSDIVALVDTILSLNACNPFGDVFTSLIAAYLQSRV